MDRSNTGACSASALSSGGDVRKVNEAGALSPRPPSRPGSRAKPRPLRSGPTRSRHRSRKGLLGTIELRGRERRQTAAKARRREEKRKKSQEEETGRKDRAEWEMRGRVVGSGL